MKILLLDNYDSFTYNLADYLMQAGVQVAVLRNDEVDPVTLNHLDVEGICLSPGPGRPEDAGCLMHLLKNWHQHLPVLGICLGHQAIGTLYGLSLVHASEPVHGKTSVIRTEAHPMFEGMPRSFAVMRYHSLLIKDLDGTPLKPLAWTDDGALMALAHTTLPVWGVQFHPESILSEHGLRLIANWLSLVQVKRQIAAPLKV